VHAIAVLALVASVMPSAVVVQPVANMYSKPTADCDVVSQSIYGTNVDVLEQNDGWARIRTADSYTGWTPLSAIRTDRTYATRGRVAEVRSMFAHLYRETDVTKHAPLVTVPFETKLEVIGQAAADSTRWLQVRLPDDRTAWAQSGDVVFDRKPLSIDETMELSKRFLGLPYTWGGTSSFGYDCSGFAQMLCRQRGVNMPRDARKQAKWDGSKPVERKDLAPGDLLYFGRAAKITHTGVYLGDGKFINATTHETPTVRIDNLDDPHWSRLLVAARRVK
jgi:gamma-D-glutamyl-L-lysine dipeptidyl-peptidase